MDPTIEIQLNLKIIYAKYLLTYRNFSNLMRPLINAGKLFLRFWTILNPLIISAGPVLHIYDFPLI